MSTKSKTQQTSTYDAKEDFRIRNNAGVSKTTTEKTPKTKFRKIKEYIGKKY